MSKMRFKVLLSLALATGTTTVFAQDVIVKHDGSTILSKVTEIGVTEVKYKKFSNQNGPTYSIQKSDIQAINYENGEKETFADSSKVSVQEEGKQKIITATPAADNAEIISRYNRIYEHGEAIKESTKPVKCGLCILGVGENSVLSTKDIVVEFRQEPYEWGQTDLSGRPFYKIKDKFFLQLYNRTDQIVYVDLNSTFRVKADGAAYIYYNNSQTTINKRSGSGASVNLGTIAGAAGIRGAIGTLANGVNVGGGNTTTISTTYTKERFIAIPPHGRIPIEKYKREPLKISLGGDKFEVISESEDLSYEYKKGETPAINNGGKYLYQESDSPLRVNYSITYSVDPSFSTAYTVNMLIYMRELIGYSSCNDGYWGYTKNPNKLFDNLKKRILEYDEYTIVGTFSTM